MIAYLHGEIIDIEDNKIILLTNSGIGYELFISEITKINIEENKEIGFYVYHHITEANQSLFGFLEKTEKQLFEELIKISGIGGKVAIQILSLGENTLISAVQNQDKKMIESVKGIGKKMAEKIILELKDKDFIKNSNSHFSPSPQPSPLKERGLESDIISTLTAMGYQKQAILEAFSKIDSELKNMQEIIPAVIKEL